MGGKFRFVWFVKTTFIHSCSVLIILISCICRCSGVLTLAETFGKGIGIQSQRMMALNHANYCITRIISTCLEEVT